MMLRVVLRLTATTAALAVLAACSTASSGSSKPADGGGSPSTSTALAKYTSVPTKLPVTTPLTKKPPTGKKVVYLQNGSKPGQQFSASLQEAVKPLGWTEQDISYDPSNPATLGSAFEQAINGGADVIEIQGTDGALYAKYVPAAKAKNIVIVDSVSSGAEIPGVVYTSRAASVGKPQAEIAVATILADAEQRNVTAHVLKIGSVLFTSLVTPFMQRITTDLKAACPSCTDELYNLSPQATISNQVAAPVVSYLQAHPDINYIVLYAGAASTGLLKAIAAAGLGDDIRIVGATPLPPQIQDLKDGNPQVLGWIANTIVVSAWMTIDAAARVMVGDDPKVYAGVAGPIWLLTKDSGSALVNTPYAPLDYKEQFARLWSIG